MYIPSAVLITWWTQSAPLPQAWSGQAGAGQSPPGELKTQSSFSGKNCLSTMETKTLRPGRMKYITVKYNEGWSQKSMRLRSPGPSVMQTGAKFGKHSKFRNSIFSGLKIHDTRNFKLIQSVAIRKPPYDPHPCQDWPSHSLGQPAEGTTESADFVWEDWYKNESNAKDVGMKSDVPHVHLFA